MKLSCSVFSAGRIPSLFAHLSKPICSSTKSSSTTFCPRKLKTPLFLRPPTYSTSLSDLKKWHDWAKKLASSIGNSFVDLDNGPDSSLLCRELKWLIEDSLEDPSLISQLGIENHSMDVRLRACLDELYVLWRQRIEERRPFQYIVGCEHWRDLVLSVEEGVLIPRPETELIVDLVKDVILNCGELKEGLWADLGTGSGAIAIDIGRILGNQGRVFATDISRVAVSVATDNVERYGLQVSVQLKFVGFQKEVAVLSIYSSLSLKDVIEVRKGSWFEPLMDVERKLAGVVSNPPYIPSDDISGLQAEVGQHEPRLALDGGISGMDDLLHLSNGAAAMLKPGGFFAFETNGEKQCKFLVDYLKNNSPGTFCNVNTVSDFAGIERFVTGFRQ